LSLQLITAPVSEPLDWEAEVKGHIRVDSNDEETNVKQIQIPGARQWCEGFTNRALITQTWKMFRDHFPGWCWSGCSSYGCGSCAAGYYAFISGQSCPIEIPLPPLRSITHIKYYDAAGVQQTWSSASYETDPPIAGTPLFEPECQPYRVWPVHGQAYPGTQARRNAVEIQFVAGYGDEFADVPAKLRQAMLLQLGAQFEQREEVAAKAMTTAERLAWPFRVQLFVEAA